MFTEFNTTTENKSTEAQKTMYLLFQQIQRII